MKNISINSPRQRYNDLSSPGSPQSQIQTTFHRFPGTSYSPSRKLHFWGHLGTSLITSHPGSCKDILHLTSLPACHSISGRPPIIRQYLPFSGSSHGRGWRRSSSVFASPIYGTRPSWRPAPRSAFACGTGRRICWLPGCSCLRLSGSIPAVTGPGRSMCSVSAGGTRLRSLGLFWSSSGPGWKGCRNCTWRGLSERRRSWLWFRGSCWNRWWWEANWR